MRLTTASLVLFFKIWSASAAALPEPEPSAELLPLETYDGDLEARQADSQCTNTAVTRPCWGNGYSIATNYDASWPTTGKTVSYNFDIQNVTLSLDGIPRPVYAVNGQYPGPAVRARWGDVLEITVTNSLTTNGTGIHWHGIRQYQTNQQDGTPGLTECPIPPGGKRTYRFLCTQFGTSWYHSHYSGQYADGVVGPIIIEGPTTANYDVDLGAYPITDWFHTPVFELEYLLDNGFLPKTPSGDNILINGTQKSPDGSSGTYATTTLTKGKRYKLRLINTSLQDYYSVGLDNHTFTVVAADFVPVNPYTTKWLTIAIGQRYDVIFTADQNVDSYWFHAVPIAGCADNLNVNGLSVFTYAGASRVDPPDATAGNAPASPSCNDPSVVPYVKLDVPSNYTFPNSSRLDVNFGVIFDQDNRVTVQWNLNATSMRIDWAQPTLSYVESQTTNYPARSNIISLPQANTWSYWIIEALPNLAPPQPHPMHLHGHDFYVLGQGSGTFDDVGTLNFKNPPRRDVATLPAGGYLVLAFITDNPGAWLMHCHIAWHIGLGLGAQFLEQSDKLQGMIDPSLDTQCGAWDSYYGGAIYKQTDSGL